MWRGRHCGVCSWTAVLLFYTISVHVQDVQSQSTTIGLPVTPSPSTPNPPTASTVSDVPSTVTNGSSSTVVLVTSGFAETTPDRTTATPHIPTTTPESPTPAHTSPQLITTSHGLPTTRPQVTTTTAQTTTPQITTTDAATTTPQRTATDAQTAIPQRTTTDFPTTTPQPSTTPELPTPVPTTSPGLPTIPPQIVTTDVPTITPQITTTAIPTTTPQISTTDIPSTIPQLTTTDAPTTTAPQLPTTDAPTTTPQLTTTDAPTTTTPQLTVTDAPTTMVQLTTTNEPTTTPQITTTDLPTTMPQPTTTDAPTATPQLTTTGAFTTATRITTTDLPTTTPQLTTTDSPTTPQLTTTYLPTIAPQTTTTVLQTTMPRPTTTDALVPTSQIATTDVLTTTPQITTDVSATTPEITTPVPPANTSTTTPLIIAVSPNVPEPTTNNPTVQITTTVPPTTAPATTPERTTIAPTTTPEAPTTTPDIPTTGPPVVTTTQEVTTPTLPVPTTTPELPTTTPYSPTTIPQIVTTTPDLPTTPQITTATTDFPTTTTEMTTPIPPIPTTTPESPTTVPFPTTTPEVTTTTTDFPTTVPDITTPIPVIPTTTPDPPTTTSPQIITTSTDWTTTNAPVQATTPKAPTTGPESPITSPQIASTGGPVVVVSPIENTDVTTSGLGTDTTAAPQDVDLWMPIVAGVGASMVVLIIVIIIIACVTCCNRPVQLDEKYLTDEEEMLPLGQTNGTPGRAPREKLLDRPDRNSVPRKKTGAKPKNAERYRVKESYRSEAEDQISLVKGEEVEVINKPTDDWWFGRSQQKIGWFPTKHLQVAGKDNPSFVHDEDSSLPDPPPSLQSTFLPNGTAGSDATLPIRATGETSDDVQRRASLSNLSLPPPPPELLAHEDETTPPARSVDNISIGSVSTSASLRNMPDISENTQTTPPNGRSDSPVSLASTAQESVSSSRPPSRASRTPSTLGSPNIPWMGSVGRSHVRTHPHAKAVLRTGQPDTAEESRMHLIMNTNLPDREASMRSNRSGRSSEDRTGRDRKLSMALRLSEPESALELDLPPPPPEFDSPKATDPSPHTERYIAVYGYRATDDNQLNLEEDDVITVIERDPLGWARGICLQTGKEGWFPESYVKKLGEDTKATRTLGPPQRPAPKPPTDKTKRDEAPDQSVQSGQDTLSRPRELRPRPSVRKSLMNKQPSAKGPSEVFYSPSDADDGPGRPTVAVRPSSHEQPPPRHQNRGTFGAPPPIQSEKSPTYSSSERNPSMRGSVQGSVQDTGPGMVPVKPPRQPSQRHSVATAPKPPTIVRSPSRRVSMPINFDMLEESSIDDTPSQVSNKSRRPPNLSLGSFPPQTQQEVGSTGSLSRSRPSRSSVTAAPDIMKTLEELDLQDTQLRTAIETFTMRGPGYLNFNKGDVILELEESDIPGWSYGELQDGTRGIFPVSSTENAATFV